MRKLFSILAMLVVCMTALPTQAATTSGWTKQGGHTCYQLASGAFASGWTNIGSNRYYFSKNGLTTGFLKEGEDTYYLKKTGSYGTKGKMLTGWQTLSKKKYYFVTSGKNKGKMVKGLYQISKKWYYFDEKGVLWGNFDGLSTSSERTLLKSAINNMKSVTSERKAIMERAFSLIGKITYSGYDTNKPSNENPKYLDCATYVANAYYMNGYDIEPKAHTDILLYGNQFKTISRSSLKPGDIFITRKNGHARFGWERQADGTYEWFNIAKNSGNHTGLFVANVNGKPVFIHCTGSTKTTNPKNRGIKVATRTSDQRYRRWKTLK